MDARRPPRSRPLYAALVAGTVVLGLASRRFAFLLPSHLAKNAGDALYATMSYWGFAFLAPRARALHVAMAAIAFCFAIELSQLYHAPFIDSVRATRLGALVLGSGFHGLDLLCYVIGMALAVGLERAMEHRP
jgi:hypothetical protein